MSVRAASSPVVIGVSLKMYFSHARTVEWCRAIAQLAREHWAVQSGNAQLFVIPTYPSIPAALAIVGDHVAVGGQDLSTEDAGALTGEVSGAELAEIGCRVVEVGHAERRVLFGETTEVVRAKTAAALRNGLAPVLCIGEERRGDAREAARECIRQLNDALSAADDAGLRGRVIVAYEPQWAIGAPEPAPPEYIRDVGAELGDHVHSLDNHPRSALIYGGSAGPGLLTEIAPSVDGLFLGRFAHDPAAVEAVLDEVQKICSELRAGQRMTRTRPTF
jgi:triosephosphate isomerase